MRSTREASPGRMRHCVNVQQDTSDDGDGDPEFTSYARDVPCNIVPVSGSETYRGRQLEATISHLIYMRRVDGLLPTMRLVEQGTSRQFNIIRVLDEDGRRTNMEVQASEVVV